MSEAPKIVVETEYKIDKGVPVPAGARYQKYPFKSMEIGDSFFVPGGTNKTHGSITSGAQKALGHKYTIRQVEGGLRVWRVA